MDICYQEALGLFLCPQVLEKISHYICAGGPLLHFFLALEVGHLLHGGCLVHTLQYKQTSRLVLKHLILWEICLEMNRQKVSSCLAF